MALESYYKVASADVVSLADAIRARGGTSASLAWPIGFISAVSDISGSAVLESLSVSQNGHYTPSAGIDGFSDVVVSVSGGGGSNDNFKIACGVMSGSIFDAEVSTVRANGFISNLAITDVEMLSVNTIGYGAFQSCSNLTTASFPACVSIENGAFMNCSNLTTASFPACASIGDYAFYSCRNLTTSFPSCTIIGISAFQSCNNLTTVSFPACASIGSYAFQSCSNLTTASFPACIRINGYAFQHCIKLESIYLLSTSVVSLWSTTAFQRTPISLSSLIGHFGSIYVLSSLVEAYKSATYWSVYSDRITAYEE